MHPQACKCKPVQALLPCHLGCLPVVQDATPDACPSPTTACKDKLQRSFQLAKLQVRRHRASGCASAVRVMCCAVS